LATGAPVAWPPNPAPVPISHTHRFVFIHIPKTAGSSMLQAFHRDGTQWDFLNVNVWPRLFGVPYGVELFRELREFNSLVPITRFHEQHLPARVLRRLVPDDVWAGYFKFAFVRNPWDWVVSSYEYLRVMLDQQPAVMAEEADIAFIVANVDFANYVRARPYFAAQPGILSYLTDASGALLVDFVGRVERAEEDIAFVAQKVGVEVTLPRINVVPRPPYQEYYTPFTRDLVAREFAREIEMFGYEF
jgi:hypothetical protein